MNSESIKNKSKLLKALLKKYGHELKHSHALEIISQLDNEKNWHVANLNKSNYIKTGIKEFDKDLKGGIPLGSFVIVTGEQNRGKSFICQSIVANNIRDKKNNLLINLEGISDDQEHRIIGNLTKIPYNSLRKNSLNEQEEKSLKQNIHNKKYYKIHNILDSSSTLDEIINKIIDYKSKYDFKLLCIDYLQLISVDNKNADNECDIIYERMSKLAKALNIVILSKMQLFKTTITASKDKNNICTDFPPMISQLTDIADIVLTLNMDNKQKNVRLFLDKNKFNIKQKEYKLNPHFEIGRWI
jgi:replicative DNA helicase